MQYLYGAAIQGIQSFIFETNKLKEIIGASEIVEQLSRKVFEKDFQVDSENFIMSAAGNIKLETGNKNKIKEIVKYWQKKVEELAPGLTLSQAVVVFEGALTKKHIDKLEEKLKIARNKATISQQIAPMAVIRSRRTGKPAIDWKDDSKKNNAPRDFASKEKQNKGHNEAPQILMEKSLDRKELQQPKYYPFDVSHMLLKGEDSGWLAVIHADGNSLGQIIQRMSKKLEHDNKKLKNAFKEFSEQLETSTKKATQYAVKQIILTDFDINENKKFPFRPVVIGGDDLTLIIRADLALKFTEKYLAEFQNQTKNNFENLVKKFKLNDFKNGLTACAGIAYMKSSYPFYYAVELAESLCGDAKIASKDIDTTNVPSSISFHKIQDSFVEDYKEIIERELSPQKDISFKNGPYGLDLDHKELPSIKILQQQVEKMLEKDAPKSGIRKWVTLLHEDKNLAELWLERVKEISPNYIKALKIDEAVKDKKTHLYDVLSLASLS